MSRLLLCFLSPVSFSLLLKRKGDSEMCCKIWQKGNEETLSSTNLDIIQITFPGIHSMFHLSVLYCYRILFSPSFYTSPSISPCPVLSHPLLRRIIKSIHRCHCSFLHTLIKRDDGASVFLPDNDVFIHLYWIKNCPSLALLKQSHVIFI